MGSFFQRGGIRGAVLILGAIFVLGAVAFPFLNARITNWVDGSGFQAMLDHETSKGLKLTGHYTPLTRVGFLGMKTDSFTGTDGEKTIVTLKVEDISGSFNPLGFFLQRWQVDDIHGRTGTVMLQKTETTPGAKSPGKPWWGWVWPYRVHLTDVKIDDANILWKLKEKESGIYHTFLEIGPNGHDFEYDAHGGEFKTPMSPDLEMRHAHVLIRKPRLYAAELVLGDDDAHPERGLRVVGDAGLQEDRSMNLKIDLKALNVSPWLPVKMRAHVAGHADGHFDYASSGTGLETGKGKGTLTVTECVLKNLPAIQKYVTLTGSPDPGDLKLTVCQADVIWDGGAVTLQNLNVESEGVFRLTGTLTMAKDKSLSGQVELGLTDPYIKWLPTAKSAIFTRQEGDYHFTVIHFSGTSEKPEQDLSTRVAVEVEKSPGTTLKLFFHQAADWFDFN